MIFYDNLDVGVESCLVNFLEMIFSVSVRLRKAQNSMS